MSDELVPFAESLGVAGGDFTLGQERVLRRLYADRPPEPELADPWRLEAELIAQSRHWAHVSAIAVAMLQAREVRIAPGIPSGDLRRFLQDVRDELELVGRTLGLDVHPALERLAGVALASSTTQPR